MLRGELDKEKFLMYSISMLLEDAGDKLTEEPRDTRILRIMQNKITNIVKEVRDEDISFLVDFLDIYIDRIWFNMSVDFSYEADKIGKEVFNDLIGKMGRNLINLARSLRIVDTQKRSLRCYRIMADLSKLYRKKLSDLKLKSEVLKQNPSLPAKIKNYEAISTTNLDLYKMFDKCGVVFQSEHALAGGTESNYFFDIDRLISDPEGANVASKYYVSKLNEIAKNYTIDKLAFIEKDVGTVGILPAMSSIISGAGIEGFIVRLRKEVSVGEIKCAFGKEPKKGDQIVIINDVLTTGGGVIATHKLISNYGATTSHVIVLYDREQGAKGKLKRLYDMEVEAITTASELLKAYGIEKKDYNFGLPEAEVIPPARWKIAKLEKELGAEIVKRLRSAKPAD